MSILKKSLPLLLLTSFAHAEGDYKIIAPSCLTAKMQNHFEILAKKNNLQLINLSPIAFKELVKIHKHGHCGHFKDITDFYNSKKPLTTYLEKPKLESLKAGHYEIHYPDHVNQLLTTLVPQNMWSHLTKLSHFDDRYADSSSGVKAASWIKLEIEKMASLYNRSDVQTFYVSTGNRYRQPSLIMKVGNGTGPGIVIGAHMDTLESNFFGNMPGADDDGTGSVTIMEVARTILASPIRFKNPIYFMWYSAEEMGLVGSQHVVEYFKQHKINISEVIHFDMTGYAYNNEDTLWLLNDNTNAELNAFLEKLISTYIKKPFKYTQCGYACSDHATWTDNGYKATIAFEAQFENFNPYIHSSQDEMSNISLKHMTDFAKLALAFTVELAQPI